MSRGVMLGEVVTKIGASRAPVNKEMATMGAILNPIKVHVNGFGSFLFDGVICKTCGSGDVYTERGMRLGMYELGKGYANGNGLLAVEKVAPISALAAEAMTLERIL